MDYKKKIRKLKQKGDFVSVSGKYNTVHSFVQRESKKTGNRYKATYLGEEQFIVSLPRE